MKATRWIILGVLVVLVIFFTLPLGEKDEGKLVSVITQPKEMVDWQFVLQHPERLADFMKDMTLEEKIGQILMPDFREWDGKPLTAMNEEVEEVIKTYHLGGIILFRENVKTRKQTQLLINNFQKASDIPLMIGIDQEGGIVTRVPYAPTMPGNMALAATGDPELARKVGLAIGSELHRLGIHVDFAPVVDVNNNPNNPVIGVRSFGDKPENVIPMSLAYMEGLNEAGVAAVAKHFPGHGDVDLDSHYVLPHSEKTLADLEQIELKPFRALIDQGVQGIMTAHITFKEIDPNFAISKKDGLPIETPATLSTPILTDLLRKQLNFNGVVFSDAMNMKAISEHFGPAEAAIRAVNAGIDVVLMPEDLRLVFDGLIQAVEKGELSEERIDEAVERVLTMKVSPLFQEKPAQAMSLAEAFKLEKEVAKRAVTVVKNDEVLPFEEGKEERITLVGSDARLLSRLKNSLHPYQWRVGTVRIDKHTNWVGNLTKGQKQALSDSDKIIIVTNSTSRLKDYQAWQYETIRDVLTLDKPTVMIASRNPYDYKDFSDVDAFIAQYDSGNASFDATAALLYGIYEATGKLPVELK